MAVWTKVTDNFPITTGNGDIYRIREITEYHSVTVQAGTFEEVTKVWYETESGEPVIKNGGTYTLPRQKVVGVDNRANRG